MDDLKSDKKIFGLSRNVIAMGVVSFLNDLATEMILPFISIFLVSVLGATATIVGIIEGIADSSANIFKIVSGVLSDKIKKRKIFLMLGYGLSALSKPLLAISGHWSHVLALRFSDRVGKGLREPPRDALITFSTPALQTGRAFGYHRAMDTLGASFGPLLGAFLLPFLGVTQASQIRNLFWLSAIAGFFAIITIFFFVRETRAPVSGGITSSAPPAPPFSLKNFSRPFYVFLIAVTIFSLGNINQAFLFLKSNQLGVALVFIPILYFFANLLSAILDIPFGVISDKIGRKIMLFFAYTVFAVVSFGFSQAATPIAASFLFVLWGVFIALNEGPTRAMVRDLVPVDQRASGYGLLSMFVGLSLLPGNLLFGYIWDVFGSSAAFWWSFGTSLSALVAMLFVRYDASASLP